MPLGRYRVTDLQQAGGVALAAEGHDFPGELVPDDDREPEPAAGPAVPFPDVKVGTADACVMDPDEDVAGTADWSGDVPQGHARTGGVFEESAHAGAKYGSGREQMGAGGSRREREGANGSGLWDGYY